jgi:plasmid stabilization system protein ParE
MTPFPQRGTTRDDIRPGPRTVGFERRVTIAFTVVGDDLIILRILYAGRSLDLAFD